jgi:cadmium resistance transport/sequestration family protein
MGPILNVLGASVTTFAATNLDDLFLLTVFFAQRVPRRRIVIGQYLGFAAIIVVSLAVCWGVSLAIPREWIRLLGIIPLAVGIKTLLQNRDSEKRQDAEVKSSLSIVSIAAITLANGADNIGVYVPFFVISRANLWLILTIYGLLVFVWCAAAQRVGNHALVLKAVERWGHWMVPIVLIGLGSYILLFTSRTHVG